VQREGEQRLVLARAEPGIDDAHDGGRGSTALDHDAAPEALELIFLGYAADARVVLAFDLVAGMEQARREFPVVGEEQQALRVVVEPAHGVDVLAHLRQQVEDRRPTLGILPRGHVPTRLVEQDVAVACGHAHALAVHADVVVGRVGPGAQFEYGGPVHRHPAVHNQRLRRAPRRDAGGGEDLLEAIAGGMFAHCARQNTEYRRQKTEDRSKKQEARSKKN